MHAQTVDSRLSLSPAHREPGYEASFANVYMPIVHNNPGINEEKVICYQLELRK